MRTRVLAVIALALLLSAGCGKKGASPSGPGREVATAMGAHAPGQRRVSGARSAARREATGPVTASAACPKGAWSGHPLQRDEYTITVTSPKEAKVGAQVQAVVTVLPKKGYHVNQKYPTSLTVQSAVGLAMVRKSFEKSQVATLTREKLAYRVGATVKSAGHHVVKAELSFSVCTPKLCLTEPDMCVAWELTGK